jgi:hypothetical protein
LNPIKILAIVLVVAGGLGLAYGGFTYTRETHKAVIGPIEMSVKDTQSVNVPIWASAAALAAGVALLLFGGKSR